MHVREKKRKISLYSIHANPMTGNEFVVAGNDYYVRIFDRRCIRSNGVADIKFKPWHMVRKLISKHSLCSYIVILHCSTRIFDYRNKSKHAKYIGIRVDLHTFDIGCFGSLESSISYNFPFLFRFRWHAKHVKS